MVHHLFLEKTYLLASIDLFPIPFLTLCFSKINSISFASTWDLTCPPHYEFSSSRLNQMKGGPFYISISYIKSCNALHTHLVYWAFIFFSFFFFFFFFQVLNRCYSAILVCLSGIVATVATVFFFNLSFVFFFLLNIYKNPHIYCYTDTKNFIIFSQL